MPLLLLSFHSELQALEDGPHSENKFFFSSYYKDIHLKFRPIEEQDRHFYKQQRHRVWLPPAGTYVNYAAEINCGFAPTRLLLLNKEEFEKGEFEKKVYELTERICTP